MNLSLQNIREPSHVPVNYVNIIFLQTFAPTSPVKCAIPEVGGGGALPAAQQPYSGLGRLAAEVARSHTLRQATHGRTPLDERSARHRDIYMTTHNTRVLCQKIRCDMKLDMLYCSLVVVYHKEK